MWSPPSGSPVGSAAAGTRRPVDPATLTAGRSCSLSVSSRPTAVRRRSWLLATAAFGVSGHVLFVASSRPFRSAGATGWTRRVPTLTLHRHGSTVLVTATVCPRVIASSIPIIVSRTW